MAAKKKSNSAKSGMNKTYASQSKKLKEKRDAKLEKEAKNSDANAKRSSNTAKSESKKRDESESKRSSMKGALSPLNLKEGYYFEKSLKHESNRLKAEVAAEKSRKASKKKRADIDKPYVWGQ